MTKITNKTPHPYDIHTKDGVKVIDAFGTLEAEFDAAYLELIKLSFDVEDSSEVNENADRREGGNELSGEGNGSAGQTESGMGSESPAEEYEQLAGKKPDGRWNEERVLAEIAKLKA